MDFRRLIRVAEMYPDKVLLYPLGANLQEMARKNAKRDAYVRVSIEDEDVVALRGPENRRPLMFMVRIPRDVMDMADAPLVLPNLDQSRAASGLILPAGVG